MLPGRYASTAAPTFADRYLDDTPWRRHGYPARPAEYEVDRALEADQARFVAHLRQVLAAGMRIPCVFWSELESGWTSDLPTEQERAAALCRGCPALDACADYGRRHPAERGVYGGVTERQRRRRGARAESHPCTGTG
ncbi:WhiB family transcriptional regulator [Georgenia sp. SYP-B2076]|uniref:WhiB family transcriptional regulator n=1 Tax=Georgenia sp. SYP-B2076 TaxID=2495881 RepID=UPI000F8F47AA|nr:WhiB family transcriptional regulator [Georgenia sp. SYP-B2076]